MGDLVPPERFGVIETGLFRSNYPMEVNFRFLRTLGLRTAVNLTQERLVRSALAFFAEQRITLRQLGEQSSGGIASGVASEELIKQALEIALDGRNYPLLLMSSSGNHGVGLIVGCLRRLQRWSISSALDEYRSFAAPAARYMTEQAIEVFDLQLVDAPSDVPPWYASLTAADEAEEAWHAEACARLREEGRPIPAYLERFFGGYGLLAADEAAAQRVLNESDDD
ncbi:hypothetical protein KFE25_004899 [Diacronema lutheri]|uniref:Uncharacterized protein n=1 Tax=Diacronema lutheri TaxID=2081491 RepID=A0A8J6CDC1_DIALT|nr:hypothetical protein KFE25_004899 [Diacronema lutheri]